VWTLAWFLNGIVFGAVENERSSTSLKRLEIIASGKGKNESYLLGAAADEKSLGQVDRPGRQTCEVCPLGRLPGGLDALKSHTGCELMALYPLSLV
jgi:hypothetical protein